MAGLLERAVPFARFQVERTLEGARDDEALGDMPHARRDRAGQACFQPHPELVESAVRTPPPAVPAGRRSARAANGARQALDRREQCRRASSPSASRCRARRGEARRPRPGRRLQLPGDAPRRGAAPRPSRVAVGHPRRSCRADPARGRAATPPTASTPPRPRSSWSVHSTSIASTARSAPVRGGRGNAHARRRAPEQRDPASPAVGLPGANFTPFELVFAWSAPGSLPNSPPAIDKSTARSASGPFRQCRQEHG